ncbi:molybdopterin-dependent oxidoreductase [Enterobacter ludwigii]|uniref:molybdopterin-dependent oxidoreductase n=1 Tax=Enterobacter ludwigii TaxID=299767 RepID=UPI003FD37352
MARLITLLTSALLSMSTVAFNGDISIFSHEQNGEREPIYIVTKKEFDKLPHKNIVTMTPWTDENIPQYFSGVPLNDILKFVGLKGSVLKMHALNDYEVMLPMEDIEKYNVILADKMNGNDLKVRDFGPYFVIYPLDDNRNELNTPKYLSRFIWQVDEITVME